MSVGTSADAWFAAAAPAVAQVFDLGSPQAPMTTAARGEQGIVWRLETASGTFAVKQHLVPRAEADLLDSITFQERAGTTASYTRPLPVRTTAGNVQAVVDGAQVSAQTWADLAEPDLGLDPAMVGRMLADLHVAGEARRDQVDPWYTAAVGRRQWEADIDSLERVNPPAAAAISAALPDLLALEAMLVPPKSLRTCHRDLWADNVRATPRGDLCVIDWDNTGPADPGHELAVLLFEFGYPDDVRTRSLYDAYRSGGGPGRVEGPGSFTMVIAQLGHFYQLAIDAWLDPRSTADDHRRARARLEELMDNPLTPAAVDRLLRVVQA